MDKRVIMKKLNLPINVEYLSKIPAKLNIDFRNRLTFTIESSFEIITDRIKYCIDEMVVNQGMITLKGWVIDVDFGLPPPALIIANGSRILKTSTEYISRSDVSNEFKTFIDEFGFNIELKLGRTGNYNLEFWALLQDKKAIFIRSIDLSVD
jgi:hypothetical protein